jgi:ATP-dependent DNA ligase
MAGAVFHSHITSNATEELKYDGFRSLAIIHNGRCELVSRNGHPFNSFTDLRRGLTSPYQGKTVLDGEIKLIHLIPCKMLGSSIGVPKSPKISAC